MGRIVFFVFEHCLGSKVKVKPAGADGAHSKIRLKNADKKKRSGEKTRWYSGIPTS